MSISLTVPRLNKFPLESDTETTARTTADLSLLLLLLLLMLLLVSMLLLLLLLGLTTALLAVGTLTTGLAADLEADDETVMLRDMVLGLGARFGASNSTSFVFWKVPVVLVFGVRRWLTVLVDLGIHVSGATSFLAEAEYEVLGAVAPGFS
jgi:hypothetical protein